MKIAVLCCGQLRSFLKCKDSIETHILSKNNCSLFVYTDTEIASTNTKQWNGSIYSLPKKGIDVLYKKSVEEITKLVKKYNCNNKDNDVLDRIRIEPHYAVNSPNWWDNAWGSFDGTYFNCFNKQQVFVLLKEYIQKYNFKFDYVLYIRPDLYFYEDINIEKEILKIPELRIESSLKTPGYVVMYSELVATKDTDLTIRASTLSRNGVCDAVCWTTVDVFEKIMPNLIENIVFSFKEMKGLTISCYESAFWLSLYKENISRYVLYKDYATTRIIRPKIRCSQILRVRIKKTSTKIFICSFLKFRTFMIAIVLLGYPIYFQFFSDKYVRLENWYERERR